MVNTWGPIGAFFERYGFINPQTWLTPWHRGTSSRLGCFFHPSHGARLAKGEGPIVVDDEPRILTGPKPKQETTSYFVEKHIFLTKAGDFPASFLGFARVCNRTCWFSSMMLQQHPHFVDFRMVVHSPHCLSVVSEFIPTHRKQNHCCIR